MTGGATDPAFANPDNEIWLDLSTDGDGNGSAQAVVDWQFGADRRADRSSSTTGTPPTA